MNTEKTEWTTLKRGKEKKDETWRTTKKLGTLLGDREEMLRWKKLAASAFNNLRRIWSQKRNKIKTEKRMLLYNTFITPILVYYACTWALTETELEDLEIFRRKQLRRVTRVQYPRKISNEELYSRCKTRELLANAWTCSSNDWRHTCETCHHSLLRQRS